jgi:ABC-type lipoprotein release transport system permease subunit
MAEAAASPAAPRRKGARPFSGYEFMLALRYLRARKRNGGATVIAILSFLGIMLAIAALITVMSVMNGFRHELLTRLLGVQPHVYVYLSDASVADELSEFSVARVGVFFIDDLQAVIAHLREADLDLPLQFTNFRH